ncbi:MAG: helix-hairpin-helix domain-containing protein [Deltaproteobacteria bacterium]|nr:helix-hairpin-helix domain-containing protein [Deltaproteobacteria bacterium]
MTSTNLINKTKVRSSLSLPPSNHGIPMRVSRRFLLALFAWLAFVPLLASPAMAAESKSMPEVRVNINAASLEQLQYLPGVGENRAQAILALRQERGGFKAVQELLEVKGIGEASLAKMEPHLALSGKTTTPQ